MDEPVQLKGVHGVGATVASLRFHVSRTGVQVVARYQDEQGTWRDGVAELTQAQAIEVLRKAEVHDTVLAVPRD